MHLIKKAPIIIQNSFLNIVRKSICNHKATFYPIKLIHNAEYATEHAQLDHCHLRNKFQKDLFWRPTVIDDFM